MNPLVLISGLATGGAERVIVGFMGRLRERSVDARLCTVTSRHDGSLAAEVSRLGILRVDLGARRLADPLALLHLLRRCRTHGHDLIHAHGQDASILAAAVARILRLPLVITRHVLAEPKATQRQRWRAALALFAARQAVAVVAVSSAVSDWLVEAGRVPRRNIQVIPNGIDVGSWAESGDRVDRHRVRRTLGFGPDAQLVLLPAVMREGKGHGLLLSALPAIRSLVPHVYLLFAGEGELELSLKGEARRYGDAARFLGMRDDLPALLQACDVVTLPSCSEGLPTVLIEGAAAGRPLVATRVGGAVEIIEDARSGLLVPVGDAEALAVAISRLLLDRELACRYGRAARRRAIEHFDLELHTTRIQELWRQVAGDHPTQAPTDGRGLDEHR